MLGFFFPKSLIFFERFASYSEIFLVLLERFAPIIYLQFFSSSGFLFVFSLFSFVFAIYLVSPDSLPSPPSLSLRVVFSMFCNSLVSFRRFAGLLLPVAISLSPFCSGLFLVFKLASFFRSVCSLLKLFIFFEQITPRFQTL